MRSEQQNPGCGLVPAAVVFSRVVSHPCDDVATCDAGSKAIAVDAGDPCAEVLGHPGLRALKPSEEHLPLRVIDGSRPERGRGLFLIPRHVCPTVNLAEEALLIERGEVREIVPVSAPVDVSNVAQTGWLAMLKLSESPSGSLAVGTN